MSAPASTRSHGAVFLSYASQDSEAAQRICDALRASGVEVWFDQNELVGGDAWDAKIRKQIAECALFVPIISAATQARREGYFRLEWKLADERTHQMAEGTPFLLPVVIDGTSEREALVPKSFLGVQWTRLPDGAADAAFCARVKRLLAKEPHSVGRGIRNPPSASSQRPELANEPNLSPPSQGTRRRRLPSAVGLGAFVALVLGISVYFAVRKPALSEVSAAGDKSIAVLPFVNRSTEKETEFFTDGVHEDILTNLAHIRELRVVSRTSVMEYRDTKKKIPQIARELGVAFVLEGSVQRAGNKVRVTGQLIRAATDEHVWAENFDRDVSDIFGIQSELAQKIAASLQAALSPAEQKLIAKRLTQNSAAYDAYLKGRAVVGGRIQGPNLQEQEAAFTQAVKLDPNFAEAWGELAVVHGRFTFVLDHTPARAAKADEAMSRALSLGTESPEILRLLGRLAAATHKDYPRAVDALNQVLSMQPNDPRIWAELAGVELERDNLAPALAAARKAVALDPANVGYASQLAYCCMMARRWDEAIAEQRRINGLRPDDLEHKRRLALLIFQATGDVAPMEAFFASLAPRQVNSPDMLLARKEWYFLRGNLSAYLKLDRVFPYHPDLLTIDGNAYMQPYAQVSAIALLCAGDATGARVKQDDVLEQIRADTVRVPDLAANWNSLGLAEMILGHREPALAAMRRALEISAANEGLGRARYLWEFNATIVEAWIGDKDRALDNLARLMRCPVADIFTQGVPSVHGLRTSPLFKPLKDDPRWEALLSDPKINAPLF